MTSHPKAVQKRDRMFTGGSVNYAAFTRPQRCLERNRDPCLLILQIAWKGATLAVAALASCT